MPREIIGPVAGNATTSFLTQSAPQLRKQGQMRGLRGLSDF
jgi:hypothetical protein